MPTPPLTILLPPSLGELRSAVRQEMLASTLGQSLGRAVRVHVADTYAEMETTILSGQVALVWGPPHLCARVAPETRHVLAAQRSGRVTYASALVVRSGEGVDLASLRGRRAAWVDPKSSGGFLLATGWLRTQGLKPDELFSSQAFYGSYAAALGALLTGDGDVAAVHVSEPALGAVTASLVEHLGRDASRLEALAVTGTTPSDALLLTQTLPVEEAHRIRDLLTQHDDPGTKALLHACAANAFVEVRADRYSILRPAGDDALPSDSTSSVSPDDLAYAAELERLASYPLLNPSPILELSRSGKLRFLNPAARAAFPDAATWGPDHPLVQVVLSAEQAPSETPSPLTADVALGGRRFHFTCAAAGHGRYRLYGVDVTQLWQAQQALRSADRLISVGTMAAGVAHELNNPLAWLSANLEVLREAPARDPEQSEILDDCLEATRRMARIVQGFKGYSREDEGRRPDVHLHNVVKTALRIVGNEVRHRARLTLALDDVPLVDASETQLTQVVLNLVVNALQAFGDSVQSLTIATSTAPGGQARLTVTDTGPGIAAELIERVWKPFFTTKPVGEGTGLGLAICRNLVEAHGGAITLASSPGTGTRISVTLPASQRIPGAQPVVVGPALQPRQARVLVIDDEPGIGRVVRRILSAHDVVASRSAPSALTLLEADRDFDLVLCDVMMPGFDGVKLYGVLSRRFPGLAQRVCFMTGGAFSDSTQAFLAESRVQSLSKPFAIAELRALVAETIAGRAGRVERG